MKVLALRKPRGAMLVFALLCSAVAVLGLTCWIIAVTSRGQYIDELYEGAKRRMARTNGRIIATRYVQRRVLPAALGNTFSRGIGTYFTTLDNYEWGGVELTSSWTGSPLTSLTPNVGINRISYGDTAGFGLRTSDGTGFDLPVSLLDGSQRWSYRWQARSYSPVLGGDLFVVHRPASGLSEVSVTGNIAIHGRAFFWMGADASIGPIVDTTVTFDSYATSDFPLASRIDSNDVVTNYPPVPNLAWASTSSNPYHGGSDVVWDANTPGYSLKNKALDDKTMPALYMIDGGIVSTSSNGYSSDGLGAASVDLSSPTLQVVVVQNAATLELKGQSTQTAWNDVAGYPSVLVVYHQAAGSTYNLTTVNLTGKNNRRVVLGLKKDAELAGATFSFPDAASNQAGVGPEWKLIAHLEALPAAVDFTGNTLNLTGGIVTNRTFSAPSASGRVLHVYRELVPVGLTAKSPRRAWSEGFKLDE